MTLVRFRISISLDGFVAGPEQSVRNPLGIGGTRLHEWAFATATFRRMHGLEGGDVGESDAVAAATIENIGSTIMGRNMFGGHPGDWDPVEPWNGWWGQDPPFHHPVFVLTHHAREPLGMERGTSFEFVTDGIESALAQARRAARGRDISLAGGANVARQFLKAGLVDEMWLHQVPTLLGAGERLFEGIEDLRGLKLARTIPTPQVTHLEFTR